MCACEESSPVSLWVYSRAFLTAPEVTCSTAALRGGEKRGLVGEERVYSAVPESRNSNLMEERAVHK
jgi:hypothetical protein